jgi:hypothetical protein
VDGPAADLSISGAESHLNRSAFQQYGQYRAGPRSIQIIESTPPTGDPGNNANTG